MNNNSLMIIALVAMIISAVGAGYSYVNSNGGINGFAGAGGSTNIATINITIVSAAAINFTTDNINFGSGRVADGYSSATLQTPYGNVWGNWTNQTTGFIVENIGNLDVSLALKTGKNAAGFLGGTNPSYQWNVSNNAIAGETWACLNSTSGIDAVNLSVFREVDTNNVVVCSILQNVDSNDTFRIDVKLVVPIDSPPGAVEDTFTAFATPV